MNKYFITPVDKFTLTLLSLILKVLLEWNIGNINPKTSRQIKEAFDQMSEFIDEIEKTTKENDLG